MGGMPQAGVSAFAWVTFLGQAANGECFVNSCFNVRNVIREASGQYRIFFERPAPIANYAAFASAAGEAGSVFVSARCPDTGTSAPRQDSFVVSFVSQISGTSAASNPTRGASIVVFA